MRRLLNLGTLRSLKQGTRWGKSASYNRSATDMVVHRTPRRPVQLNWCEPARPASGDQIQASSGSQTDKNAQNNSQISSWHAFPDRITPLHSPNLSHRSISPIARVAPASRGPNPPLPRGIPQFSTAPPGVDVPHGREGTLGAGTRLLPAPRLIPFRFIERSTSAHTAS